MNPNPPRSLAPEDIERMTRERWPCHVCGAMVSRNYCLECDEYFLVGHRDKCIQRRGNEHPGHTPYLRAVS